MAAEQKKLQSNLHFAAWPHTGTLSSVLIWKNTLSDWTIQESHLELLQSVYRSKVHLLLFLSAVFIYLFFTVWEFLYLYRVPCFCAAFNPEDYSVAFVRTSKWQIKHTFELWPAQTSKCVLDEVSLRLCEFPPEGNRHTDVARLRSLNSTTGKVFINRISEQSRSGRLRRRLGRGSMSRPLGGLLSRLSRFGIHQIIGSLPVGPSDSRLMESEFSRSAQGLVRTCMFLE